MIDGFSVFDFRFFLVLLVVVVGDVVERRRGIVFNTAGAGGEDCLSSVCVGKEDDFALHCGFTHSKGSRACVKNVQVHKGATELRN